MIWSFLITKSWQIDQLFIQCLGYSVDLSPKTRNLFEDTDLSRRVHDANSEVHQGVCTHPEVKLADKIIYTANLIKYQLINQNNQNYWQTWTS